MIYEFYIFFEFKTTSSRFYTLFRVAMIHLTKSDAILCIDVQNDFLPGGQLPSHKGDLILENIFTFISNSKILVFASRDWHPENHCSFTPQGGPWPSHCVRDTWGASFPIGFPVEATRIVSKGTLQEKDAYSAFNGTNLAFDLKKADIKRVFVLGYCTEYCVESTAKDAIAAGLEVYVISDLCAPVNSDNVQSSIEKMSLCGIKFTTTAEFSSNGTPFIIQTNAPGLANYPHARKAGGFLFISGISCRNVDNTWKGVEKRQDGTVHLDISVQSRAVIEKYFLPDLVLKQF